MGSVPMAACNDVPIALPHRYWARPRQIFYELPFERIEDAKMLVRNTCTENKCTHEHAMYHSKLDCSLEAEKTLARFVPERNP